MTFLAIPEIQLPGFFMPSFFQRSLAFIKKTTTYYSDERIFHDFKLGYCIHVYNVCVFCSSLRKNRWCSSFNTPLIIILLCFSEVDKLLSCIGKSLTDQKCGSEAITLKDKLTRTLIRGSLDCGKVSLP